MKPLTLLIMLVAGGLVLATLPACSSTGATAEDEMPLQFDEDGLADPEQFGSIYQTEEQRRQGIDPSRELIDHLRNHSILNIRNHGNDYTIRMRGSRSIQNPERDNVMFVINNSMVGRSYTEATSLFDMHNVQAINILRPDRAHLRYGPSASGGVIQIIVD